MNVCKHCGQPCGSVCHNWSCTAAASSKWDDPDFAKSIETFLDVLVEMEGDRASSAHTTAPQQHDVAALRSRAKELGVPESVLSSMSDEQLVGEEFCSFLGQIEALQNRLALSTGEPARIV